MDVLVTCGPTYEPLDQVRRLTNFSTGQLGLGLANHFLSAGHQVRLLKGYYSTARDQSSAETLEFTTTDDLLARLQECSSKSFDAVFHAAAVSDFKFGAVFRRESSGELTRQAAGKFATRGETLLAELLPTPKVIRQLRPLFPKARLFGWKYEVDGNRQAVLELGARQMTENQTDFCILNGPAYGDGFGILAQNGSLKHCEGRERLYAALLELASGA